MQNCNQYHRFPRYTYNNKLRKMKCKKYNDCVGYLKILKLHLKNIHPKIIKCKHCSFFTSQNKKLEEHIEFIHKEKEKYPCEVC